MKNAMDYFVNIICQHRRMRGVFVDELKLIVTDILPKFTENIKQSKKCKIEVMHVLCLLFQSLH